MGAILYFGPMVMPPALAIAAAIVARLLLTGALHEDGLADFFDGFGGGGSNRERILSIMKDSRIGTYGVLSLIAYFAILFICLYSLPTRTAAFLVVAADPFAKMLAGQIVQMMPYARNESEAKAKVVYRKVSIAGGIFLAFQGLLPTIPLLLWGGLTGSVQWLIFAPCLMMYVLYLKIWHTLRGYTGDCCGAIFLLVELTVYITAVITCK